MELSNHGCERLQQRAIPSMMICLLLDYGERTRRKGADVICFTKHSRKQMCKEFGGDRNMRMIEPWLNSYAVVSDDGCLITAGRRTKRLRRP